MISRLSTLTPQFFVLQNVAMAIPLELCLFEIIADDVSGLNCFRILVERICVRARASPPEPEALFSDASETVAPQQAVAEHYDKITAGALPTSRSVYWH
jgi:hypothetical protein